MIDKYIIISAVLFLGMGVAIFIVLFPLLLVQHFIYKKILDPLFARASPEITALDFHSLTNPAYIEKQNVDLHQDAKCQQYPGANTH